MFEENHIKLCENFTTAKSTFRYKNFIAQSPFCSCEMSCETTCKHTCVTSQVETPSSQLRTTLRNHLQVANQVANHLQVAKSQIQLAKSKFKLAKWTLPTCEIHLYNLRYLQPTQLDFFSRYFVNFYFLLVIS